MSTTSNIKKAYLSMLNDHPKMGWDNMVGQYPEKFGFDRTTIDTAKQKVGRAVMELERDGFVEQEYGSGDTFKIMTDKGRRALVAGTPNFNIVDIEKLLSYEPLKNVVRDDYLSNRYDNAIFNAFKMLEEEVRQKSQMPSEQVGVSLMNLVFSPKKPILEHGDIQIEGEKEALRSLMSGGMGLFRNTTGHRTVGYSDPQQVAQILGFANYLLELLTSCKKK